jgi:catechol 2,3-dioxygenase-like lactoylglutathione lyase family enzyme
LAYDGSAGHFAPVRVNPTLTLDFGDAKPGAFEVHHYAFHVDDDEFDAILARIRAADIRYGSAPWQLDDGSSTPGTAAAASISATRTAMCWSC